MASSKTGGINHGKVGSNCFGEFWAQYETNEACHEALFRLRFPDGFVCPKCGYRILTHSHSQCLSVLELPPPNFCHGWNGHAPHTSALTAWFWAMYLCATDKRGISASQLSRLLGVFYESAWYLLDRIRTAMGQRDANYVPSELVEMDGVPAAAASVAVVRTRPRLWPQYPRPIRGILLFAHMQVGEDLKTETLQEFANQYLTKGSVVQCDGCSSYRGLTGVNCHGKMFDASSGDLKWLHKSISNLKALLLSTYHGHCSKLQS